MAEEPVQVLVKLIAPKGQGNQIFGAIRPLLGSIRSRAGCIDCQIYFDAELPDEVVLYEQWENEASFLEHVRSKDYRYILEWVEQSQKSPQVTVGVVTERNGLEFIQKVRAQH